MKERIDDFIEEAEKQASGGSKTFNIASQCREEIIELKGEFDYLKARFSPQFVQRVDKALEKIQNFAYDLELVKM